MVNFLLQNVGPVAIQAAAEAVRRLPVATPETAPEGHPPDGCPMCQAHDEVATARALLEAMTITADQQGRVPRHMASTVLLVEQHLRLAQDKLPPIAEARPDLAGRTQDLRTHLEAARLALPDRQAMDLYGARTSLAAVESCWRESVALADVYFGPRPVTPLDDVREVLLELPPADRERFIASLQA